MKKIVACLVGLALVAGNVAAQNKTNGKGEKIGRWTTYYDNGKIMYEGTFANGMPVGEFKRYYDSGKLKLKQNFEKSGEVYTELYRPTGKLLSKGYYNSLEQKIGEWTYYSQKGEVLQTEHYTAGKLDGLTTVYTSEGKIFETIEWKSGKKDGSHKQFFPNGQLQSEVKYKDGLRNGECTTFFDDGTMEVKGAYANDKKEGVWIVYDRDGKTVLEQRTYKDGKSGDEAVRAIEEQEQIKRDEENAGKIKDPADYKTSPDEYFLITE